MFHVKQRIREKIREPFERITRLAATAIVIAAVALLAVLTLAVNVSRGTTRGGA